MILGGGVNWRIRPGSYVLSSYIEYISVECRVLAIRYHNVGASREEGDIQMSMTMSSGGSSSMVLHAATT